MFKSINACKIGLHKENLGTSAKYLFFVFVFFTTTNLAITD